MKFCIQPSDEKLKVALVVVNMPLSGMAEKFIHLWNIGKSLQLLNFVKTCKDHSILSLVS